MITLTGFADHVQPGISDHFHRNAHKVDIGLAALIPQWRARAREFGLARSASEARPPRPLDPDTGRRSPRARVAPPDLPANVTLGSHVPRSLELSAQCRIRVRTSCERTVLRRARREHRFVTALEIA